VIGPFLFIHFEGNSTFSVFRALLLIYGVYITHGLEKHGFESFTATCYIINTFLLFSPDHQLTLNSL
jgi:hypothetical protein